MTFDQGTAMLFGFGTQGFNPHRCVMNELSDPIEIIKHELLYRLNYGGVPIAFHADLESFFAELLKRSAGDLMRRFVTSERVFKFFNKLTSTHCYTLATPTTIERYTRKNGGAVAGPKQAMGQELLNRPHTATLTS